MEAKLVTLALIARLNNESDDEVIKFFKNLKGECSRDQAMRALADSKELLRELPADSVHTVAGLYWFVKNCLDERERRRIEEEREWISEASSRLGPPAGAEIADLLGTDDETNLAVVASQLPPGKFLTQARMDWTARDPQKEHSFREGDVFVIAKVSHGNEDDSAWYFGYRLDDVTETQRWIFSQYVTKIYS